MIIIAQVLHGICGPFAFVPTLPEMIESVQPHYPKSLEGQINDMSSGIINTFFGIGQFFGPVLGSLIHKHYGFQVL